MVILTVARRPTLRARGFAAGAVQELPSPRCATVPVNRAADPGGHVPAVPHAGLRVVGGGVADFARLLPGGAGSAADRIVIGGRSFTGLLHVPDGIGRAAGTALQAIDDLHHAVLAGCHIHTAQLHVAVHVHTNLYPAEAAGNVDLALVGGADDAAIQRHLAAAGGVDVIHDEALAGRVVLHSDHARSNAYGVEHVGRDVIDARPAFSLLQPITRERVVDDLQRPVDTGTGLDRAVDVDELGADVYFTRADRTVVIGDGRIVSVVGRAAARPHIGNRRDLYAGAIVIGERRVVGVARLLGATIRLPYMRQAGTVDDDGRATVVAATRLLEQDVVELPRVAGATTVLHVGDQPGQGIGIAVGPAQQVFQVVRPQAFGRRHALVAGRVVEHEGAVGRHGVEAGGVHRATDDGALLGLVTHIGADAVDHAHLQDRGAVALVVIAKDVDVRLVARTIRGNPVDAIADGARHQHIAAGVVGDIDVAEGQVIGGVVGDIHRWRAMRFHRTGAADIDVGALQINVGTGGIDIVDQQDIVTATDRLARIESAIQRLELVDAQAGVTNAQVGAAVEGVADGDLHIVLGTRHHLAVDQHVADDRTFGRRVRHGDRDEAQLIAGRPSAGLMGEIVSPCAHVDVARAGQRGTGTERGAHLRIAVGYRLDHRHRHQATHIAFGRSVHQQVAFQQRGAVLAGRQVGILQ
ncbi:hypothetical protein D3C71_714680 [compost metagenome]